MLGPIILGVNVAADQLVAETRGAPARFSSAKRESFASALVCNYPGLTTLLHRHTGDPQLAEDILHDAILTTLTKLDGGTLSPTAELAGYVFRTALNHLRNHRRRARLRAGDNAAVDVLATDTASPDDQSQRDANTRAVRRVLHGLGSLRDRELLVRFYLDEESKQDICAAFGLDEPAFNRVICRARERLRRLLENIGIGRADLFTLLTIVSLLTLVRYW
jgi:RNA polymerase sigma-70 factor, ECF subfamily